MSIIRNPHLDNCCSIEAVVELVNRSATPEVTAGQYAFDAALETDDLSDISYEAHLEFLEQAGAKFCSLPALIFANKFAREWIAK